MLRKDEIDLQDLKNELADRKEELNAANRKLHTLKGNEGLVSQPSLPLPVCLLSVSRAEHPISGSSDQSLSGLQLYPAPEGSLKDKDCISFCQSWGP